MALLYPIIAPSAPPATGFSGSGRPPGHRGGPPRTGRPVPSGTTRPDGTTISAQGKRSNTRSRQRNTPPRPRDHEGVRYVGVQVASRRVARRGSSRTVFREGNG